MRGAGRDRCHALAGRGPGRAGRPPRSGATYPVELTCQSWRAPSGRERTEKVSSAADGTKRSSISVPPSSVKRGRWKATPGELDRPGLGRVVAERPSGPIAGWWCRKAAAGPRDGGRRPASGLGGARPGRPSRRRCRGPAIEGSGGRGARSPSSRTPPLGAPARSTPASSDLLDAGRSPGPPPARDPSRSRRTGLGGARPGSAPGRPAPRWPRRSRPGRAREAATPARRSGERDRAARRRGAPRGEKRRAPWGRRRGRRPPASSR